MELARVRSYSLGVPLRDAFRRLLGWEATIKFDDLVKEMVIADLALVDKGDFTS